MTNPYKCRVEYLESTGTQYIDTNILAEKGTKASIDFQLTELHTDAWHYLFQAYPRTVDSYFEIGIKHSTGTAIVVKKGYSFQISSGGISYRTDLDLDRHTASLDDVTGEAKVSDVYSGNVNRHLSENVTYYPFRILDEGIKAKIYGFNVKVNGVLTHDMIPVIDNNNIPAMYDQVSGQLFYNSGTGQFKYKADNFNKKLLRKKLALMLANLKKKRKYYCEVEYLESDGNQFIDTGYVMTNDNMTYDGNIMWTQNSAPGYYFFGYRSVNLSTYRGDMRTFFVYGASSAGRLAIRYGMNTDNSTSVAVSLNTKCNISWDGSNLKVNGTTYVTLNGAYNPPVYKSMYLFWCNCTGYYSADVGKFVGRIYNWRIKQDGVLVRDFIPVLDWDMKPCMYDRVSEQLFYNQGTGDFTAGREIHQVEYLESTGTQYINTLYKAIPATTKFELSFTPTNVSDNTFLFGARPDTSAGAYTMTSYKANARLRQDCAGASSYFTNSLTTTGKYLFTAYNATVTLNDESYTGTTTRSDTRSDYDFLLFTVNTGGTVDNRMFVGKVYSSKLWDNGTPVRDFIPAISEDGTAFMFDRVSHTIYDNAGTGAFKYPAREVEYINFDGAQYIQTAFNTTEAEYYKYEVKFDLSSSVTNSEARVISNEGTGSGKYFDIYYVTSNNKLICRPPASGISFTSEKATVFKYDSSVGKIQGYYEDDPSTLIYDSNATFTAPTININYKIGSRGNNNSSQYLWQGKIYYVYFERDGLTCNFVSAFKDGAAGMLDKKNNVFYQNAGTGTFTTGKIVEPEYE